MGNFGTIIFHSIKETGLQLNKAPEIVDYYQRFLKQNWQINHVDCINMAQ